MKVEGVRLLIFRQDFVTIWLCKFDKFLLLVYYNISKGLGEAQIRTAYMLASPVAMPCF